MRDLSSPHLHPISCFFVVVVCFLALLSFAYLLLTHVFVSIQNLENEVCISQILQEKQSQWNVFIY
jgi:hypothetical protein